MAKVTGIVKPLETNAVFLAVASVGTIVSTIHPAKLEALGLVHCAAQGKVTRFWRQNLGTFSVQRCKNLQNMYVGPSVFVIEKLKWGHYPYQS